MDSLEPVLTEEGNKLQGLALMFAFKLYLLLPNRDGGSVIVDGAGHGTRKMAVKASPHFYHNSPSNPHTTAGSLWNNCTSETLPLHMGNGSGTGSSSSQTQGMLA